MFKVLQDSELYINLKKCEFMTSSLLFLVYVVSVDGIKVDKEKVRAIKDCFHRLTLFYKIFIQNFSSIISLTDEASKSFTIMKGKLCSTPILALLNFDKLFEVECDAFIVGIGGVLSQEGQPIIFFSKKLYEIRKKWTTYELEFYVVIDTLQIWEHYLIQREFVLYTDH
ncbi:unnamed protein product [Spirodela intermedia]|uniref:Reverse transcriptase/retrotransposon-derived protein RNase H-like domain-containing protein n=1 Tax=Spirodela intermedia TaxID=51605 RepID=A0A7I8KAM9_SPIIN|nr:unnamed protein product [Spirodela intermedia]